MGKKLPLPGTLSYQIIMMVALSGEMSATQLGRLPAGVSYIDRTIKQLRKDNFLHTYFRDGLRGLRLTQSAKRLLLDEQAALFQPILSGSTEINRVPSVITRRIRLHRMAEVMVTMSNTGVKFLPWEKQMLFQEGRKPTDTAITHPMYYSSKEVKDIGIQSNKIRGSRAIGVLLTPERIFSVYNMGETEMRWEYKSEIRLKVFWTMELCHKLLPKQFSDSEISGIVFADTMRQLPWLLEADGTAARSYFLLDGDYEHFFYLTNDHMGEVLLQLLCEPKKQEELDSILMEDLSKEGDGHGVIYDGVDAEGGLVLFGYTCDLPRIKKFDTGLALHELKGTLICFDFQEASLRAACGDRVTLQSIDFEAYERSVFNLTQEAD